EQDDALVIPAHSDHAALATRSDHGTSSLVQREGREMIVRRVVELLRSAVATEGVEDALPLLRIFPRGPGRPIPLGAASAFATLELIGDGEDGAVRRSRDAAHLGRLEVEQDLTATGRADLVQASLARAAREHEAVGRRHADQVRLIRV